MRIIFAGTPDFTLPIAESLTASAHDLCAIYTRADRRTGRGRTRTNESLIKTYAAHNNVPLEQPEVWDKTTIDRFRQYRPDLVVVIAYGMLLPAAALTVPPSGCVNLHLSLLPRWRGAAPVARALLAGDTVTGVSLIRMTGKLDAGDIIQQHSLTMDARATTGSLYPPLINLSEEILRQFLQSPQTALMHAQAQDEAAACAAPKLSKHESYVVWTRSADEIDRQIRALMPWPVARTRYNGRDLLLHEAEPCPAPPDAGNTKTAGTVSAQTGKNHFVVRCGHGYLEVRRVQPAGSRILSARDFLNGRPGFTGTVLNGI